MEWKADKIKHYSIGFKLMRIPVIVNVVLIIMKMFPVFELNWWILAVTPSAFILLGIIAASKELIHDKLLGQGTPEWDDFKATMIGGIDGMIFRKMRFGK